MPERTGPQIDPGAGLLDTSVLVSPADSRRLPEETAISAISMAELGAGPHATDDPAERARRQERLQVVEALYDPLPFDAACARAYPRVYAAVARTGRKARGRRFADLQIATVALANGLPLYTGNASDLHGLEDLLAIVEC